MKAENYKLETINDTGIINRALSRVLVNNVKDKKQKIGVTIQNADTIRNLKQNALIHVIFKRISDATESIGKGIRVHQDDIKAMLKDKYLGYNTFKTKKKIIYELKSTAKMTKKECAEFTNNILDWCKKYKIEINVMTDEYDYLMGKT